MSESGREPSGKTPTRSNETSPAASSPSRRFPIIAIGASAGGLDAFRNLVSRLPPAPGMAFIFVQHLDPNHESLLVSLLADQTPMTVCEAADGMAIEPDHLYVIPAGTYLSVAHDILHLSNPNARHGARLPFDFLLNSLARDCGRRTVGIVLSGTGGDGSIGLKALNAAQGLVIVQDPKEAGYDGMPRSAIATGLVDFVLPVADMPRALSDFEQRIGSLPNRHDAAAEHPETDGLSEIIELLRERTAHDFRLYKPGTLERRIERRMSMAAIKPETMEAYLKSLRDDPAEIELLAKDLLINVTNFFRDPEVFEFLAKNIIPEMIESHDPNLPIRIWVAGCSSGEETYSIAMIFREALATAKFPIKLQIFASDVDTDAVALAREGLYPETIETDVSGERLARFFTKNDHQYRVSPELRSAVVFTVQDVMADPPFSNLDLVSCRNLLIYLRPEAQAMVLSAFHFALRGGGVLLLGTSETVGDLSSGFKVISKPQRIYRQIGQKRGVSFGISKNVGEPGKILVRATQGQPILNQTALAELCRRLVVDSFAPAALLINAKYECLYSLGPTDRYLRVAPGNATHDLLAMVRPDLRIKLRAAIYRTSQDKQRHLSPGGRTRHDGRLVSFSIDVQPVTNEGEDLLLVCFVDEPAPEPRDDAAKTPLGGSREAELERELATTRMELQGAIRNLEMSGEEQKAINEEALSVNEEYQSTNEELLTSKEELQSLNEELTALNSQIHETLERQRTTSNDLKNILYSTDVATLFLDRDLKIRFFTPATRAIFAVIVGDIGRPLADLRTLVWDQAFPRDAQSVLRHSTPIEREIESDSGAWYTRRILPYRTHDNGVEGVVVTFTDITERKRTVKALEEATRAAEVANVAKTRFLAAANHDLRQPLQTLALLQGLLAKSASDERSQKLVARMDETLGAMSGMLNALLDVSQIESGTVHANHVLFPITELLDRLRGEFEYHAQARGLDFRVVSSTASVYSDPRLLEQMVRNLVSNALKYTRQGRVLVGCRRHAGALRIEILDTGIGIPEEEQQAIFEEYHQIGNQARERSLGLGLGLSIVQRLGKLLGHRVTVQSKSGRGSVFAIEIPPPPFRGALSQPRAALTAETGVELATPPHIGTILVVEDDPELRELLVLAFEDEGQRVLAAADGEAALQLLTQGNLVPNLILADYNLPKDLNGLQLIATLRAQMRQDIPGIILTGDVSTKTARAIASHDCIQHKKPVQLIQLSQTIQRLLATPPREAPARARHAADSGAPPTIFIVDDDAPLRETLRAVLEEDDRVVEDFADCESFLEAYHPGAEGCLLIDAYLPGMSGLTLLRRLAENGASLPSIMITGDSDVPMAVAAMKAGAADFIEKPVSRAELLRSIDHALELSRDSTKLTAWRDDAAAHLAGLTERQRQIMDMVLAGHPSKNIAADLGISQRTVENHRASIMKRTGSRSLPALARLALAAASSDPKTG